MELALDSKRRHLIERNHSATHLLHAAISEILGKHVEQKGSYCDENYLRFDFTSMDKLSSEDLNKIEALVNEKIAESIPEETKILPVDEAKNLGAEMEFSEKYGSVVRVVCFEDFSKEFCGGTHVKNTSEIGLFVLESESSVSAGTRRIQARTSLGAYQYLRRKSEVLASIESETLSKDDTVLESVKKLERHIDELQAELNQLKDKMSSSQANELQKQFEEIDGIHFLAWKGEGERGDIMKLGDSLKSIYSDYVLFLCGKGSKGYSLVVFAGGKGAQIGAGKIMKEIAPILGGNGGGKPEMASGSAKNLDGFEAAISKAKTLL